MTFLDLSRLAFCLPEVQKRVADLLDFNKGFEVSDEQETAIQNQIASLLEQKKTALKTEEKFELRFPKPNSIVLTNPVSLQGRISPPQDLFIYTASVTPDVKGYFNYDMPLTEGKNTIVFFGFGQTKSLTLYKMTGHPTDKLTRSEFAHMVCQTFDFSSSSTPSQEVSSHNAISILVEKGILKGDENGVIHPFSDVTRAEALTAIVRCVNPSLDVSLGSKPISFLDVSRHWVKSYLHFAVTNGLLDPGRYFYPNRPILRQEVIKILEKTHALQEKLEKLFIHD